MALGAYNFGNILKETNAEGSEKFDMGIKVSFLLPLEIFSSMSYNGKTWAIMALKEPCRQYRELRNIEIVNVGWWNEGRRGIEKWEDTVKWEKNRFPHWIQPFFENINGRGRRWKLILVLNDPHRKGRSFPLRR